MFGLSREDLLERLQRLDEDVDLMFEGDDIFNVVIVGGGALILLERIIRMTHDVDILSAPSALLDLMTEYDMNTRVKTFCSNFPYNYEDRLIPIDIPTKRVRYYTASLEDIVIAKLCSYRDKDFEDISSSEIVSALDWGLLDHLAHDEDELRSAILNERNYEDFLVGYERYVRRFHPCDN